MKTNYSQNLLFSGYQYNYDGFNDGFHVWILNPRDLAAATSVIASEGKGYEYFRNIVSDIGNYYGTDDLNDRDSWTILKDEDIVSPQKTINKYFKEIVYQEGNYFGVPDSEEYENLIRIDKNQVLKLSKYNPGLSVLVSTLVTPVIAAAGVVILWLSVNAEE
ncbi:hypothetical protein [Tamlana flava]|uniref:hypothetical protein n=1 Tax=Tamlana flava TaxID=3158572 RepID=UPI00351B5994